MEAPPIRYCTTSDRVNIAYYSIGKGIPYVFIPTLPASHLTVEWQSPLSTPERMASLCNYVRYDPRGFGLSERDVSDFSVEALTLDLEAVANQLNLPPFVLMAIGNTTAVAIAYAAKNPGRVSHLILFLGCARSRDLPVWDGVMEQLIEVLKRDFELALRMFIHGGFGWSHEEGQGVLASIIRAGVTPGTWVHFLEQNREWDVTGLLPSVTCRTLVLHRRDQPHAPVEVARRLASNIPNAQLTLLEGSAFVTGPDGDSAMLAFVTGQQQVGAPRVHRRSGTAVILFADIADSTALTERVGDAVFRERARRLEERLLATVRECGGAAVEGRTLGDGVLATFASAREAIQAGVRCARAGDDSGLALHVGIHAGDVIREDGNVYGGAVNIAARISDAAPPGEVLVSDVVHGLARTSADVAFEDRGEQVLKGIEEPVRVWTVRTP